MIVMAIIFSTGEKGGNANANTRAALCPRLLKRSAASAMSYLAHWSLTGKPLSLSPDGKKLAYTILTQSLRIWSLPFDAATGQIRGTIQPVTAKGMNAALSDLSRDGKKLSFDSWRTGKHEFWEKSLEDDREKLLATEDNGMHAGAWSRDGTRLVGHRQSHFTPDESRILDTSHRRRVLGWRTSLVSWWQDSLLQF
jgi:hypothetical protein